MTMQASGATPLNIQLDVDFELLLARIENLDKAMRNPALKAWREGNKAAADVIRQEWARRARSGIKKSRTGNFIRGGKIGSDSRGGYVSVVTESKALYAAVQEFGGSVPVPHSMTNPRLYGKRRLVKPWIGGVGGTSYYLYPAKDAKLQEAADVLMVEVQHIIDTYLGGKI